MKVLVTGARGQLGHDMMDELRGRGHEAVGVDVEELDVADGSAVAAFLAAQTPDAVIHCAAWTAVDAAEDMENIPRVRAVNADGTRGIARACRALGCKMLYVSTDYVFDGRGDAPWRADCRDFAPLNVYGQTKLEGEQAVCELVERRFIVRVSWLFGAHGVNFVQTMLRLGCTHGELRVVDDQIGTPTYSRDLARLLADMAQGDRYGVYHATNEGGYVSRSDLAREIFRQAGYATRVIPVSTAEYGFSKANRPLNSRLDKSALTEAGFAPLPPWKDALARYLREIEA